MSSLTSLANLRAPRRLGRGEKASVVEHLDELRSRLFVCVGALVVGAVVGFVLHAHLIRLLEQSLPGHYQDRFVTLAPGEAFMTSLWVSIYFGLVLAMPVVLWQIWAFLAPAVERRHAQLIRYFTALAALLAAAGIVFGY